MKDYLSTTFSPMMMGGECVKSEVVECTLSAIKANMPDDTISVVGHETTALILSVLLSRPVEFNRVNLKLKTDDRLFVVIPGFRADVAREFTEEEVLSAGFRCFIVKIS